MFNFKKIWFLIITILFNNIVLSIEKLPQTTNEIEEKEFKKDIFDLIDGCAKEIKRVEKNTPTHETVATLIANAFKISDTNINNRFKTMSDTLATKNSVENVVNSLTNFKDETNQRIDKIETFLKTNVDLGQQKLPSHLNNGDNLITKDYFDASRQDSDKLLEELKRDKNRSYWSTRESTLDFINHNKTSIGFGILCTCLVVDKIGLNNKLSTGAHTLMSLIISSLSFSFRKSNNNAPTDN